MCNSTKMIIRNDDVSVDTTLDDIKWFCELCDKHKVKALQCITVFGDTHDIDVRMSDEEIKSLSDRIITDNEELIVYLLKRNDLIAVHGLWHTHAPSEEEIAIAKKILKNIGFNPTYFVPPFNEGEYQNEVCGLKLSAKTQRLEDYLTEGTPTDEIVYLHSWRFMDSGEKMWYNRDILNSCLQRIIAK